MQGVLRILCCCILVTSLQWLNGVYTSAVHYKKDLPVKRYKSGKGKKSKKNKKVMPRKSIDIFIMVDKQIDPNEDTEHCCNVDHEQNELLVNTVNLTASSDNSTAFIIDTDTSEAHRALAHFSQHDICLGPAQVGIHTFQALIGLRHKNKLGSINYYYSDYSGNALLSVIRSFEIIERFLECFTFKKVSISLFCTVQGEDRKKKTLVKRYGPTIKEALLAFVPDVTVLELHQNLQQLMEKKFNCDGITSLRGLYLVSQALRFVETPATTETLQVRDYVWNFFVENSLAESQFIIDNWVYPLQKFLSVRGIEDKLREALQNYQTILISCRQDKILSLHTILKNENFYIGQEYKDTQQPLDTIIYSNFLDIYHAKVGSQFYVHTCRSCHSVENKEHRFINEQEFPEHWFCSKECVIKFKYGLLNFVLQKGLTT